MSSEIHTCKMAPSKFQIYVDQSIRQATSSASSDTNVNRGTNYQVIEDQNPPTRFKPEKLADDKRFYFDERQIYPLYPDGGELSFEEIKLRRWLKNKSHLEDKKRIDDLERENEELRQRYAELIQQIEENNQRHHVPSRQSIIPQSMQPTQDVDMSITLKHPQQSRLSVVPQSLQPAQDADMSLYDPNCSAPTVVHDMFCGTAAINKNTSTLDKFTVPIDQSQYIRENVPTSTPTNKGQSSDKRPPHNIRRFARPSMDGSPTLKLSPIVETSREFNSKSSSSSSASTTPGTVKKNPLAEPILVEEPDRPLDPNDPTTYRSLLKGILDPLDRRNGFYKLNRSVPKIRPGACFQAGQDSYLVDKELSQDSKLFKGQLLTDDSDDDSAEPPIKAICLRVDQPSNEWLFYICSELHRRLVKQKAKPDIELSVMITNPAVVYSDGSVLVDEYFRFVTLQHFFDACIELNKPFPKPVAAFITTELLQIIRQIHSCNIAHMNINPKNIIITGCPTRDDIKNVEETTSIVKLIGFDRAMDFRLLPSDYKFETQLDDLITCEMMDSKPWTYEVDWFGTLGSIYKMFFLEEMSVSKINDRWNINKKFKGSGHDVFPTSVWSSLFEKLLNIDDDIESLNSTINSACEELSNWVRANVSCVLKGAVDLEKVLEDFHENKGT